ncbi:MAG: heme-binding protein [Pirellulaceae bacterium]|nr:MAG: heme-binding protein [Pirellulaceae bacterium]
MNSIDLLRLLQRWVYRACLQLCPSRPPWLVLLVVLGVANVGRGQEASWIWSPEHAPRGAPEGNCFFRKSFQVGAAEQVIITITADDAYELFVNGRRVGTGNSVRQLLQYDVTPLIKRGLNVVAVRVTNVRPGPAALAARVMVKPVGGPWRSYASDGSWLTSLEASRDWMTIAFNDSRWRPARVYGVLGQTAPWDRREEVPQRETSQQERFQISPEFAVEEILTHQQTGSLVNIAFNEFGHLIAAREDGPLLLVYDSDQDGVIDRVREYGNLVHGVQGILPLNGDVYVTGTGEAGTGVYRLIDADRNGELEEARLLVEFEQTSAEHGLHGLTLGPEGMIYCVFGNHARLKEEPAPSSPLQVYYEGDLVTPRYEDPGGHARGVRAPGGGVVRFDLDGERVELVAGGLRNSFDLVFDRRNRLFVHDSDMEADQGAPWYRPPSLYEIAEGGEYGWRSGWAKWPAYYYDRLPPVLETGRGSPTGCCLYDHFMFPRRYHGNLFLADWTAGHILVLDFDAQGHPQSQVFLRGQPLNVTDVAVGPDGWLYFCTGGRGTRGGVYQVRWKGKVPSSVTDLGEGMERALKQPQLDAAWARQELATLQAELGSAWEAHLQALVGNERANPRDRLRALKLMQLLGPIPSSATVIDISRSSNAEVRQHCAMMLGQRAEEPDVTVRLNEMLHDPEAKVRIAAAEALLRGGQDADIEALRDMLASGDRREAWSARRLLERMAGEKWREQLYGDQDQRVRLHAGLATMIAEPTEANGQRTQAMILAMLDEFIPDRNFADLLRLTEVMLHRVDLSAPAKDALAAAMLAEFPVGQPLLNRELVRILTHLNVEEAVPEMLAYLQTDAPLEERLHVAMHLRFFEREWTAGERLSLVKFLEQFNEIDVGSGVPLYVMQVTRDLCRGMSLDEARIFLSEGAKWPNAALIALYQFPEKLESGDLQTLVQLDRQIDRPGYEGEQYKRLRTGIVAMLTQHGSPEAMATLREIWIRSPERRQAVALGLATQPDDENWDYLVRSLPVLESFAVDEVMKALQQVPVATDDPQALREVILHGLRRERDAQSPQVAIDLLRYWTGEDFAADDGEAAMQPWQQWYAERFPDELPATLPEAAEASPWTIDTLAEYFASSDGRRGDPEAGRAVFEKAQCARCHRYQNMGASIGPDLTHLTRRFTRNEVLEAVLYPSQNISDQYQSYRILTRDGKVLTGTVASGANGSLVVRDSNLHEHVVAEQDVEEMERIATSMMPMGLFDDLTSAEIRDLMTFFGYLPTRDLANQPAGSTEVLRR